MTLRPFETLPRSARRGAGRWVALAFLLAGTSAGAAEGAPRDETIQIRYSAPPACVDAATFRERLLALPVTPGAPPPRGATVAVTISGGPPGEREAGFTGAITVAHPDGTTTARQVTSASCEEVCDALAFVAALALGLDSSPLALPSPRPAPLRPGTPAPPEVPPVAPPRWRFLGAIRGALVSGAGPSFELAPDVALGVALDAPGLLAPTIELSGTWTTSGDIVTSGGVAVLTLWQAGLEACPLRLALGGGFALRPCAQLSAGVLRGSGSGKNVVPAGAQVAPRLTAAPLLRVEWRPNGWFGVEGEGGPDFEITRDRFFFEPGGAEVYAAPVVGSVTRVGVVLLWP